MGYITAARQDAKVVNYLARTVVEANGVPPSLMAAPASAKP